MTPTVSLKTTRWDSTQSTAMTTKVSGKAGMTVFRMRSFARRQTPPTFPRRKCLALSLAVSHDQQTFTSPFGEMVDAQLSTSPWCPPFNRPTSTRPRPSPVWPSKLERTPSWLPTTPRATTMALTSYHLVVESTGGWDNEPLSHLKELAICSARRSGVNQSTILRHFLQRLSVILQRGNATLLINKMRNIPEFSSCSCWGQLE
jgi:hypothetical protein